MEKVFFENSVGIKLAGVYYPSQSKKAVIISHGFTSTKNRPRFIQLSKKLSELGFAVLRFDFTSCGESEGEEITVSGQVDDLHSAINFVKQKSNTKIALIGESLGGLISVKALTQDISSLVLVAPVTHVRPKDIAQHEEALKTNGMTLEREGHTYKLPMSYFEERLQVKRGALLENITVPTLIVHGDKDVDVPLDHSIKAIGYLSEDSKLKIMKDCGHKFEEDVDGMIDIVCDWLKSHH